LNRPYPFGAEPPHRSRRVVSRQGRQVDTGDSAQEPCRLPFLSPFAVLPGIEHDVRRHCDSHSPTVRRRDRTVSQGYECWSRQSRARVPLPSDMSFQCSYRDGNLPQ
jgi:hypothetical protein